MISQGRRSNEEREEWRLEATIENQVNDTCYVHEKLS